MATKDPLIPLQNFNMGGLADSKFAGAKDSFYKLTGFDPHSVPGLLKVAQKLTKISGNTIVEFCKVAVVSTNGYTYFFSSETGKIWQKDPADNIILVFTTTPLTGENKCLGAYESQNKIYWCTENYVHKIDTASAIGAAAWTANASLNFGHFQNGDKEFHPMIEQNLVLYIGDGNLVAQIDNGIFSKAAVDIHQPLRIRTLGKVDTDVLIGTFINDFVTKTEIIKWNTWSGSFQTSNPVNEVGINAFIPGDNITFVQAGLFGRIYVYDPAYNRLQSFKQIPGDYSPTKFGVVNPNAVANLNNIVLIGFSNSMGDPADEGVYRIGRHSGTYPFILDFPYPISERVVVDDEEEFALSGIEIGFICVRGFDVYVSWKRTVGSVVTTGIDKIDYSNKLNGAYFESRIMGSPNRLRLANFSSAYVAYASLPAQTAINMFISRNYEEYTDAHNPKEDSQRNIILSENTFEATTMQMRVKVTASGNDAPDIESAALGLS
jgi:hypothetical protein